MPPARLDLDEQRPRDFRATLSRREGARTIGRKARARHRGRSLLALAAAVAVPAMAAPGGWSDTAAPDTGSAAAIDPMPFETGGESFPGSAFYYLAADPQAQPTMQPLAAGGMVPTLALETMEQLIAREGSGALPEMGMAGALPGIADLPIPGANASTPGRSVRFAGSGNDKARALQCLSMAIYYEAASESDAGQKAVAQVVLNRVAHPTYPSTVCGVVFQGSERRTGCQFTFTCDGALARKPSGSGYARARRNAAAALAGEVYKPVGLATHYHTIAVNPYWAPSLQRIGVIGAHIFYTWKGAAGKPSAFRSVYQGREPAPRPHAPSYTPTAIESAATDPLALAKVYEEARAKAEAEAGKQASPTPAAARPAASAPPPAYTSAIKDRGGDALYTADKVPQSGRVKDEYARSGQWIGE